MRSFVNITLTRGCVVFRFQHLVLPIKCCLEPFDKQEKPPFACLFSPLLPVTSLFVIPLSSLYSHALSFCSFGLRFFYSRILFLSLPLHIICLLEISSIFSVRFISLTGTVCSLHRRTASRTVGNNVPAQRPTIPTVLQCSFPVKKKSFLCNREP